jgi:hypothetical protein
MRLTDFLSGLEHGFFVYADLAPITRDLATTVLLTQFAFWDDSPEAKANGGWFAKSFDEIYARTLITRRDLERARAHLRGLGVLEEQTKGVPARLYYRLNKPRLDAVWEEAQQALDGPEPVAEIDQSGDNLGCTIVQTGVADRTHRRGGSYTQARTIRQTIPNRKKAEKTSKADEDNTCAGAPAQARDASVIVHITAPARQIAGCWEKDFGKRPNARQQSELEKFAALAAERGLAGVVEEAIGEAALNVRPGSSPWPLFKTIVERMIEGRPRPGVTHSGYTRAPARGPAPTTWDALPKDVAREMGIRMNAHNTAIQMRIPYRTLEALHRAEDWDALGRLIDAEGGKDHPPLTPETRAALLEGYEPVDQATWTPTVEARR